MPNKLGTLIVVSLFHIKPSEEGAIDSLTRRLVAASKALLLGPQRSTSAALSMMGILSTNCFLTTLFLKTFYDM